MISNGLSQQWDSTVHLLGSDRCNTMCFNTCVVRQQPLNLNATETRCLGRWSFISPNDSTRLIVYQFDSRRRVREEHYYLTSATPTIPRTTMLGQWRVESDGQLIVEPSAGVDGMLDASSGKARENLVVRSKCECFALPKPLL